MLFLMCVMIDKYLVGVYYSAMSNRKTIRNEETKRKLLNRLSRIEGQITGIKGMVQDDRYCPDILIQLSAVDKAIRSLYVEFVDSHLHHCLVKDIKDGKEEAIEETIEIIRRFQ